MNKLDKIADRLLRSCFGECDPRESTQRLEDATELAMCIMRGQWSCVAWELEKLKAKNPADEWQEQTKDEIEQLLKFVRFLDTHRAHSNPREFNALYCAHRAACVLRCENPDCGKTDCWETRRWGCEGSET